MDIAQLNQLATNLDAVGKNYLETNEQGSLVQGTSSLGQRIAAYCGSKHEANRVVNRAAVQKIITFMSEAEGVTAGQRGHAANILQKALQSGKPLSGRVAAKAVREFIATKTAEDQAHLEGRRINAQGLVEHLTHGAPSQFDTILSGKLNFFAVPQEGISPQEITALKQNLKTAMEGEAIRSPRSLTEEEGKAVVVEVCRKFCLHKSQAAIAAMADSVSGHSNANDALPAFLQEQAAKRGLTTPITPEQMGGLAKKIASSLKNICIPPVPEPVMQQPTQAMAQDVRANIVGRFLDSMQTVDESDLGAEQKNFAKTAICESQTLFSTGMVRGTCEGIKAATQFLLDMSDPNLAQTPALAMQKCDDYLAEMGRVCNAPFLQAGREGADETTTMREVMGKAALASCSFIELGGARNPTRAVHTLTTLLGQGSAFAGVLYDKHQQLQGANLDMFNMQLATTVQQMVDRLGEETVRKRSVIKPCTLGSLSYAQAQERLPQGYNPLGLKHNEFVQKLGTNFQSTVDNPATYKPFHMAASEETQAFLAQMGDQFMKDFMRCGVIINGEVCGKCGSQDAEVVRGEVAKLLAHFPNVETARQVCNPFHQALAADLFNSLAGMPETAESLQTMMMSASLGERFTFNLQTNEDNTYTASFNYANEAHGIANEDEYCGLNMFASFTVTPQAGQTSAVWQADVADAIFSAAHR